MTGDTCEGEIPGLLAEIKVQYKIIAYDKAGNFRVDDNLGEYYVYTVIPEFPTLTHAHINATYTHGAYSCHDRLQTKTIQSTNPLNSHLPSFFYSQYLRLMFLPNSISSHI